MKKKTIVIIVIIFGIVLLLYFLIKNGTITFETIGTDQETVTETTVVEELEDGCFYIWSNKNETNIENALKNQFSTNVFKKCPQGVSNWEDNSFVDHAIWFTSKNDIEIPTYYPGDELIFVSSTYVPYEGIEWERFADYGYTIGVVNLEGDSSGHYRISRDADKGYEGYIFPESDASELEVYINVSNLFLDKIDGLEVREKVVSPGGPILDLKKDESYICEWYTGTYYQDYRLQANVHTFCSLETFTTYDYDFLHSRCISITIPEWFKTGYYFVDEIGFFRYISAEDADRYNGRPYDENINWNEPIIIYDENGLVEYDPTSESAIKDNDVNVKENINAYSDVGAEEYETISSEVVIQ